jgi:hypothetical protein
MSATRIEIEGRIEKAIQHLKKNSNAKRAKVAREFDVPLGRLRSRLENKSSLSAIRDVHERRLSSEQDMTLVLYI